MKVSTRLTALLFLATLTHSTVLIAEPLECEDWQQQHPAWLWCDDFEVDEQLERDYFDVKRVEGNFGVDGTAAFGGAHSLRSRYRKGREDAGALKLSLGATPVEPKRYTDQNFEDIYWRFYMMTAPGFEGNPDKITRATIITAADWSQAAIGHLWGGPRLNVTIDPASGVSGSRVVTRGWNDFDNLRWLGYVRSEREIYLPELLGEWVCIEMRMKLNTPGKSDGELALWIDAQPEARKRRLDWRGRYTEFGINAISLESWINDGSPKDQVRYFDNFVVSTQPIGCYEQNSN